MQSWCCRLEAYGVSDAWLEFYGFLKLMIMEDVYLNISPDTPVYTTEVESGPLLAFKPSSTTMPY